MATTYTTNYNLGKQENHADKFDMDVITDNADKIDAALTGLQSGIDGKQATLTTAQLAAVNSGITSTDVEQIETNKNNILLSEQMNGAKNLYDFANATITNIRCTMVKSNTSLTTTSDGNYAYAFTILPLKAGNYVFSCTISARSGSNNTEISLRNGSTSGAEIGKKSFTTNDEITIAFTLSNDTDLYIIYYTANGSQVDATTYTASNNMIITKEAYDAGFTDYQPYALSNTAITPALVECVDNGAKNLLNFSGSTIVTPPDCTITDAGDGTFIVTKTSANLDIPYISAEIKAGTYIYSGCPAGGSDNTYRLDIRNSANAIIGTDYGSGAKITIPSDGTYRITCRLNSTYTTTGLTIKPMLCDPALWAISPTFEPHAMSNAELTADVASLTAKSQKTISSSGNTSKLRLTLNTSVMSNANRGSLLLSIPFQTSSYDNALLLIAIGNDRFLGVQRLDNSNNSMVTSWALSENNTILDITLRAQPWSAPVAFPMAQVVPPITYSWES